MVTIVAAWASASRPSARSDPPWCHGGCGTGPTDLQKDGGQQTWHPWGGCKAAKPWRRYGHGWNDPFAMMMMMMMMMMMTELLDTSMTGHFHWECRRDVRLGCQSRLRVWQAGRLHCPLQWLRNTTLEHFWTPRSRSHFVSWIPGDLSTLQDYRFSKFILLEKGLWTAPAEQQVNMFLPKIFYWNIGCFHVFSCVFHVQVLPHAFAACRGKEREPTEVVGRLQDLHSAPAVQKNPLG